MDDAYEAHLASLPIWRREKALQYKKLDDRKRSVLAFVLLQRALRKEYGITEVPEFVYNEFGKPSLPNLPIHFSLSHCKNVVACAVSDHNIGIDVENIIPYNPDIVRKVCSDDEIIIIERSLNKDAVLTNLWTEKEAISKYEGLGLALQFNMINCRDFLTESILNNNYILTICYGKSTKYVI